MPPIRTHNLGYPRIGRQRELKKSTESFWKGQISTAALHATGAQLRRAHWLQQQQAGVDLIPSNDFSFYDHVLDLTCMVGNVPPRFQWDGKSIDLNVRFLIARGQRGSQSSEDEKDCQTQKISTFASEMTKWFDTNYHYIVPEFRHDTQFRYSSTKAVDEFLEAKALGIITKPVLIGPVTYLTLGKVHDTQHPDFSRFSLLDRLLPIYVQVLQELRAAGAEWVQIDEPVLALDLTDEQKILLQKSCQVLHTAAPGLRLLLTTYFGELRENLPLACSLACDGLHIDAVRAAAEVEQVARQLPPDRVLSLGIVDGRNVWKNDYTASLRCIEAVQGLRATSELWLAPSCSLLHCPITLTAESKLNPQIKAWLAFADEKLVEVADLRGLVLGKTERRVLEANQQAHGSRGTSPLIHNPEVQSRLTRIKPSDTRRASSFSERQARQCAKLQLPLFPTTTIGSFPQTQEIRAARARWKNDTMTEADYKAFLRSEIQRCVQFQEEIGIDMLVHGEFERNDMVEYFGEQLEGFAFTENGWVQSYGSRCVKPPIIFGDVSRPKPMTVEWTRYAQSLTRRPMKGMLTGPVTMLQWSFVRNDQPREVTARQIALAIRDEVSDLEKIGIAAIQIDEPAFREGLPLRCADWQYYLKWAVEAFRLCSSVVQDETQIHTHMCYSEFNDIIESIAELDADVITIETSRSNMELLDSFVDFKYPAEIGPGVYDIHSPRVPRTEEMKKLLERASAVLPIENLWVNPDCGLKTRNWEEVRPSLKNMVDAAKALREAHAHAAR